MRSLPTPSRTKSTIGLAVAAPVAMLALLFPGSPATAGPDAAKCEAEARVASTHLATFDTLDFDVFTHQKWDQLHLSHSRDIVVHWPDGHQTKGIDRHIEDLKAMFTYAPDTRIEKHPIRIGSGEWTSVVGIMEGTFTRPMATPDGKTIPPTGKTFKLEMCTIGHWKDGVMDEEYLFWDNLTFMKQIGVMP